MKQSMTKYQIHWLIFFAGLIIFLIHLNPEFIAFQTRFAFFAQEMLHHGVRLFPYTYQGPYPDYPVLPTIFIYLASLPFGAVTPFTAILPTAIASSLILVFIYQIGQTRSRHFGIYAVLLALLTQNFVDASRDISMDQMISLVTVISFYLIYSAHLYQRTKRLYWLPLLLILGFLCRGPIGLVIPAGVIISFYAINRDIKKTFYMGLLSFGLLVFMMLLLLFAAYYEHGRAFMHTVLYMEITGRVLAQHERHHFLFYWIQSFANYAITYPIAIVLIISYGKAIFRFVAKGIGNDTVRFLSYLTVWLFVILIGMSIPDDKKIRYILPIVPACALIAATLFFPESETRLTRILEKIILTLSSTLPFLAIIAATVALILNRHLNWQLSLLHTYLVSWILGVLLLLIPFVVKTSTTRKISLLTLAALSLIYINAAILNPINYALERTKPFIQQVETLIQTKSLPIVFYNIGPDGEDIKFMVNWPKPFKPTFVLSQKALAQYKKPAYFIALKSDFDQLPKSKKLKVLAKGKLGHRNAVIFMIDQPNAN